jgi:hypothetical protein
VHVFFFGIMIFYWGALGAATRFFFFFILFIIFFFFFSLKIELSNVGTGCSILFLNNRYYNERKIKLKRLLFSFTSTTSLTYWIRYRVTNNLYANSVRNLIIWWRYEKQNKKKTKKIVMNYCNLHVRKEEKKIRPNVYYCTLYNDKRIIERKRIGADVLIILEINELRSHSMVTALHVNGRQNVEKPQH